MHFNAVLSSARPGSVTPAGQIYRTVFAPLPRRRRGRLPACRTCRDKPVVHLCELKPASGPTRGTSERPCARMCCAAYAACSRCFASASRDEDCSSGCSSNPHRGGRSADGTSDLSYKTTQVGAPGKYVHQYVFAHDRSFDRGGFYSRHAPTSEISQSFYRIATARAAARASVADVFSRRSHKIKKAAKRPLAEAVTDAVFS
jgi:hypothetical protein